MSQLLINHYLADLDRLRRVSGANRESVVREAFKDLLKANSLMAISLLETLVKRLTLTTRVAVHAVVPSRVGWN